MAFDGRDYNKAFDEAFERLSRTNDSGEVEAELTGLEWILWEAIRGALFAGSWMIALIITLPISFLLKAHETWQGGMVALLFTIGLSALAYWLLRLSFWYEISRHIKNRKFGNALSQRDMDAT